MNRHYISSQEPGQPHNPSRLAYTHSPTVKLDPLSILIDFVLSISELLTMQTYLISKIYLFVQDRSSLSVMQNSNTGLIGNFHTCIQVIKILNLIIDSIQEYIVYEKGNRTLGRSSALMFTVIFISQQEGLFLYNFEYHLRN